MPEYKEVTHERLWLKEPGTDKLRKRASGRLKHLTALGWRETERWPGDRYITVRMERTGVSPWIGKPIRRRQADEPPRREGRGRGGFGQGGGPGGRGGPGGPRPGGR